VVEELMMNLAGLPTGDRANHLDCEQGGISILLCYLINEGIWSTDALSHSSTAFFGCLHLCFL